MSKDANEVLSALLDNASADEIDGDIRYFSIDLGSAYCYITARLIKKAAWETVNDNPVKISSGVWEVISYDIDEIWA